MLEPLAHRHYDTFELPEAAGRLLPSQLAISFSTDREGNIAMLSAPLEPLVKDIVFIRIPAGDCMDTAFRKDCIGSFSQGLVTIVVGLDNDGQLTLTVRELSQPPSCSPTRRKPSPWPGSRASAWNSAAVPVKRWTN